jgi:hypothetical protein
VPLFDLNLTITLIGLIATTFYTNKRLINLHLLLKYSLGMPIILASQRCPDCNTLMDIYGDHASTCNTASGVIDKNNSIVNSLMVQMKSASMNCSTEAKNLNNNSRQRAGDIYVK